MQPGRETKRTWGVDSDQRHIMLTALSHARVRVKLTFEVESVAVCPL